MFQRFELPPTFASYSLNEIGEIDFDDDESLLHYVKMTVYNNDGTVYGVYKIHRTYQFVQMYFDLVQYNLIKGFDSDKGWLKWWSNGTLHQLKLELELFMENR